MKPLRFKTYYNDQPYEVVEKINQLLNRISYEIDFDEEVEETDNGSVSHIIRQIV